MTLEGSAASCWKQEWAPAQLQRDRSPEYGMKNFSSETFMALHALHVDQISVSADGNGGTGQSFSKRA